MNRLLFLTTTKRANGQTLRVNGQSWLVGFQAITWRQSTASTSSAGTMARFHAALLSTYWVAELTAASWYARVRAALGRGRCLCAMKVECTTTASTKIPQDRSVKHPRHFIPLFLLLIITNADYRMSVGMVRILESICLFVCLFVRSITQKRMIPKCSDVIWGIILGYPRSGWVVLFLGSKVNVAGSVSLFRILEPCIL